MARFEPVMMSHPPMTQVEERPRWRVALDAYMKIVSIGYLGWALWQWAALIGIVAPLLEPSRVNLPRQGAVYFFAVFDPVAAVGLWIGSPWGAATWLVDTFARIIIHTGYSGIFGWTVPWTLVQIASVAVYLIFFFLAQRADREAKMRRRRSEFG